VLEDFKAPGSNNGRFVAELLINSIAHIVCALGQSYEFAPMPALGFRRRSWLRSTDQSLKGGRNVDGETL
jgi:hypothetical protein